MSLATIIIAIVTLVVGAGVGYYLRLIVSLGQKGSMELEIKQIMLAAKEDAQKILDESKKKVEEQMNEQKREEKLKEEEGIKHNYEGIVTIVRDILKLEGVEKVSDVDIIKIFENEGRVFETPKSIPLIERILKISTNKDSIILDSFAGSGTTAHAVLNLNKQDGGNRKFILVEMEEYAEDITAERVKRVMNGYGTAGSPTAEGTGGSFDFYELGKPLFVGDNSEYLNEEVELDKIQEYIWYSETKTPFVKHQNKDKNPYYLGKKEGLALYFIYEKAYMTELNYDALATIKTKAEQYIIYADSCLLPKDFMMKNNIVFKKIPRDITRF